MPDDSRQTIRKLPVLIGHNYEHIMANAEIVRTSEGTRIDINATGEEAIYLADFLEQAEPIALSFIAIPVQNTREKRETL